MPKLLGEFDCKLDSKGRLRVPSPFIKQFERFGFERFVVNRGIENCLTLYPLTEWDKVSEEVDALNDFVKKNREFKRIFYGGATEIQIDSSERILLPKRLLGHAMLEKDIVLSAVNNKIEIWSQELFDEKTKVDPDEYSNMAEDVMGDMPMKGMPNSDGSQGPR